MGETADDFFETQDAGGVVSGLRGPIEDLPCVRIRCERLALDDADCRPQEGISSGWRKPRSTRWA